MRKFWRAIGGGALLACSLGIMAAEPAGAATPNPTFVFTGTCQFLLQQTVSTSTSYSGNGTCSGTLTGHLDFSGNIETGSVSVPAFFQVTNEQGIWLPSASSPKVPVLVTGQGDLGLEVPCGAGGFCGSEIPFSYTQATPLAFATVGNGGGVGAGLVVPGGNSGDSVTLVTVDLTS